MKLHLLLGAALFGVLLTSSPELPAQRAEPRQKYGPWTQHPEKGYYYCLYYFKPRADDADYQRQYVVYHKDDVQKRNWLYYYSPSSQKFWARYPTTNHEKYRDQVKAGKELWSILPEYKRERELSKIDGASFGPVGGECPFIPNSKDKATIDPPPSDLP